ncbi:MAG: hypothetical protein ACRCZZ_04195 [Phocaeicola sp.]
METVCDYCRKEVHLAECFEFFMDYAYYGVKFCSKECFVESMIQSENLHPPTDKEEEK